MLRFFRQIRQRLLTDNKFSKYLLYAVGEILLVVIGILIALQIDNWNESRKDRMAEQAYLSRLKEDLEIDNRYYRRRIRDAEISLTAYAEFTEMISREQRTFQDLEGLAQLFSQFYSSEMVTTQNSTYSEMLFAGKLDLIMDPGLKSSLLNYYRRNEEISKHIEEYNTFTVDVLEILMMKAPKFFGLQSFPKTNETIENEFGYLNDPSFDQFHYINQTAEAYGSKHQVSLAYFRELDSLSLEIIRLIENQTP